MFPICSAIISSVPTSHVQLIHPLLISIDQLHQNESTRKDYESLLNDTIGTAFTVHGPSAVLAVLPLQLPLQSEHMSGLHDALNASRAWLLPIMSSHVKRTSLALFFQNLLPQAQLLHTLDTSAAAADMHTEARAYQILRLQIWDTLSAFCFLPTDLAESLKSSMKHLAAALMNEEYAYAHNSICKALSVLIGKFRSVVAAAAIKARADATTGEDDEDEEVRGIREELENLHDNSDDEDDDEEKGSKKHSHQSQQQQSLPADEQHIERDEIIDKTQANYYLSLCTLEEAQFNILLLSKNSKKFLPILFNLVSITHIIKRDILMETIYYFSSIAESNIVNSLFSEALNKLKIQININQTVDRRQNNNNNNNNNNNTERERAYVLSDIIVSMIPSLTDENLQLLLQTVSPLLNDNRDGAMQKRVYKMIGVMCKSQSAYLISNRQTLVDLINDATPHLHATAQKTRLDCLTELLLRSPNAIASHLDDDSEQLSPLSTLPVFLGEILLALKDPSKRTRTSAYDLLTGLANQTIAIDERISSGDISAERLKQWNLSSLSVGMDDDGVTASPLLSEYITMLLAGVAGTSPHMQSACLMAFSHIFFALRHNAKSLPPSLLPSLLSSLMPLLTSRSREVKKSMLGLVKVLSIVMTDTQVSPSLPSLVNGLCVWGDEKKNRFQEKVKGILTILIKKCGIDVVKPLVPASQVKLIDYVQKTVTRERKKKADEWALQRQNAKANSGQRHVVHSSTNGRNANDIEAVLADSDEETEQSAATSRRPKRHERSRAANIRMTSESVDLLDEQQMRNAITTRGKAQANNNDDHIIGGRKAAKPLPINSEGKMMLMDSDNATTERSSKTADQSMSDELTYTQHKSKKRGRADDDDDEDEQVGAATAGALGQSLANRGKRRDIASGDRRSTSATRQRSAVRGVSSQNAPIRFGSANRPSAFIPLDPTAGGRRNRFGAIKKASHSSNGFAGRAGTKVTSRKQDSDMRLKSHIGSKPNKKHKR